MFSMKNRVDCEIRKRLVRRIYRKLRTLNVFNMYRPVDRLLIKRERERERERERGQEETA